MASEAMSEIKIIFNIKYLANIYNIKYLIYIITN